MNKFNEPEIAVIVRDPSTSDEVYLSVPPELEEWALTEACQYVMNLSGKSKVRIIRNPKGARPCHGNG